MNSDTDKGSDDGDNICPVSPEMLTIIADCAGNAGQVGLAAHLVLLALWVEDHPGDNANPVLPNSREATARGKALIDRVRKLQEDAS